jgi:hypothetical protein
MQRRLLVGIAVGGCLLLGFGLMVWAGTQGLFGPHGKTKRLMAMADRALQQGQVPEAQATLQELVEQFPDSPVTGEALLKLGQLYEQQHRLLDARATYQALLERFPTSPFAAQAQMQQGMINASLLFAPQATEEDLVYTVAPGDTLGLVAQRHATTVDLIRRINELSSDVIRIGQRLKLPNGVFSVSVDKSQNQLLLMRNQQFFKLYNVSTGANNSTPVGSFKIINKMVDPVWYKQGAAVPPDSPENILGTRWLGLDKPGYGIHGTVDPDAIGQQVTAGCIRMVNSDVEELFMILTMGTDVTIAD